MPRQLDIRVVLLGLAALALVTFDQTRAADPATRARAGRDGTVAVATTWVAPENCWAVVATAPGAPGGIDPPAGTIPAVVTVERQGDLCAQVLTPVRASFSVPDRPGAGGVMVYVVDRAGKLLRTEGAPIRR